MATMTDDGAPYSGAIEESARAAGKALDLIKDASGPIADVYGIIIGDRVHAARHRRLDEITQKTKKILRDRNLKLPKSRNRLQSRFWKPRKANRARRCRNCGPDCWPMPWTRLERMT
jgi:hypothetical protein